MLVVMQRTILFRADASPDIGIGHVMRCHAIAEEMMVRGWGCTFACRELPPALRERLEGRGYSVVMLHDQAPEREQVARQAFGRYDWLILDHYGLGEDWFVAMEGLAERRMAIDDLGDRPLGATLLLDSGPTATLAKYAGRLPAGARTLLGPRYAPLRDEFRQARWQAERRAWDKVRRVLISFGGGDPQNLSARAVAAVRQALPQAQIDVVAGPVAAWEGGAPVGVQVHHDVTRMTPLMLKADLAIGAAGSSSWERCAMGLPSIVTAISKDQQAIAQALHGHGAGWDLGALGAGWDERLGLAVRELALACERRQTMGKTGLTWVDGRGVIRIGHHLEGVRIRPAIRADEAMIYRWANDPVTRANSFVPVSFSFEQHQRWFRSRLEDPETVLFIGENGSGALGEVRFDRGEAEAEAEVSITVAPNHRGGVGRIILAAAIEAFDQAFPGSALLARTKPSNVASQRIFLACGFRKIREGTDMVELRREGGA